jgi:hypothetical protein
MSTPTIKGISVLITREGQWFVAQCLEIDVATQAKRLEDLYHEISRTIVSHLAFCHELGADPFAVDPAPEHYWKLYRRAAVLHPSSPLPEMVARDDGHVRARLPVQPEMRIFA